MIKSNISSGKSGKSDKTIKDTLSILQSIKSNSKLSQSQTQKNEKDIITKLSKYEDWQKTWYVGKGTYSCVYILKNRSDISQLNTTKFASKLKQVKIEPNISTKIQTKTPSMIKYQCPDKDYLISKVFFSQKAFQEEMDNYKIMQQYDPTYMYIIQLCGQDKISGEYLQELQQVCNNENKKFNLGQEYNIIYYNYGGIILRDIVIKSVLELKFVLKEAIKLYNFLEILQDKGAMHGDIKNNNIVFNIQEGFKFIDFNLAFNYDKSTKFLKELSSDFFLHTSFYSPPENQIFGFYVKQQNKPNTEYFNQLYTQNFSPNTLASKEKFMKPFLNHQQKLALKDLNMCISDIKENPTNFLKKQDEYQLSMTIFQYIMQNQFLLSEQQIQKTVEVFQNICNINYLSRPDIQDTIIILTKYYLSLE